MPKALPEQPGQLDTRYEIAKCKLCEEPKYADDLDDGFCQKCLQSGLVKQCGNCGKKIHENEAVETQNGTMCQDCGQDLYSDRYQRPLREYRSGPPEMH